MEKIINLITQNETVITLIFFGVVTIATTVYAILTWRLTSETIKMRKAQTEPKIAAYVQPCQVSMHFMDFIVKNIGLGPAYDVKFKILEEFDLKGDRKLSEIDFVREGINYMPPNYSIETYFLHLLGQYEQIIDKKIKIEVSYKNSEGKKIAELINLNMSQFKGRRKLGEDPVNKIAKHIETMQKDLHHLFSGFHHLGVDTYTYEDRQRRNAELEEQRKKLKQNQKNSNKIKENKNSESATSGT